MAANIGHIEFFKCPLLPIFEPILMVLLSKFMIHRVLSDKTYLSIELLSRLIKEKIELSFDEKIDVSPSPPPPPPPVLGVKRIKMSVNIITSERELAPKIKKNRVMSLVHEIVLLCFMTHCLVVLYNCMKFHLNSFNGF